MDLGNLLADISAPALSEMSEALEARALRLAQDDNPGARAWARLYGFLSLEMDCAALRQLTGVSL